jgi:hypothetical protein
LFDKILSFTDYEDREILCPRCASCGKLLPSQLGPQDIEDMQAMTFFGGDERDADLSQG